MTDTIPITNHPLLARWQEMIQRCTNPKNKDFKYYGGRGIKVCDRWKDFRKFDFDMMPTFKSGLSIERVDNDKGYSPDNCKWATAKEQQLNRRVKYHLTFNGRTQIISKWAKEIGVNVTTLRSRKVAGQTDEQILQSRVREYPQRFARSKRASLDELKEIK